MIRQVIAAVVLTVVSCNMLMADLVFYTIPGMDAQIKVQGTTRINPGGTVTYEHPRFGKIHFGVKDVVIHRVPTTDALFTRQLVKARKEQDASAMMAAARWALNHGLLADFYEAVDEALKIDPQNTDALAVRELKRRIDEPLGSTDTAVRELRELVPNSSMRVDSSKHFVLLHDTPAKSEDPRREPRSTERLELLETVYESFLLRFYSQGVELEIPGEYLKAVLFSEHSDYLDYATSLSPELKMTSGFWSKTTNISVFYDQGTDEMFHEVRALSDKLHEAKERSLENVTPQTRHVVRLADTISLIVDVIQENADIEVVSHEVTHQMAGNTGLMPRDVITPTWVAEGIATYFESPNDAAWSGIGAVNEERLKWYRELERRKDISNIDFIVGDQIFTYAASHGELLHGYGQAWALTHFLLERHFDKTMTFYRRLGEMPPHVVLDPELLTEIFNEVFGDSRRALDAEWRAYMKSLKPDIDRMLEESESS